MSDHYDRYNGMEELLGTNLAEVGTDCISRHSAIDVVSKWFEKIELNGDICVDGLKQLPSVQPKRGKWRHYEQMLKCSECGSEIYDEVTEYFGDDVPHFCPNCGADMRGEQDDSV